MSVYCHRITELKTKDGWVNCGDVCDNYHGFADYNNEDYANRGLPDDTSVSIESYRMDDMGGGYCCYGMSYITLPELLEWIKRERNTAINDIKNEFMRSSIFLILKKLNGEDVNMDDVDSYDDVVLNNHFYEDIFDEITSPYEGLNREYISAYTLAENKLNELGMDDVYVDNKDVRIVFYFD